MNAIKKLSRVFLIFSTSISFAFASGDSSHPGNNPLIVGGVFGLFFTFISWVTADQFSNTPSGNYKAIKWISGLALGLILAICLAMLFDGKLESGLKSFVAIGYLFFALPQVILIYYARNSALGYAIEKTGKSGVNDALSKTEAMNNASPVYYTTEQTEKMIADYLAGVSVDEIANEFGKSPRSVTMKLIREGVAIHKNGGLSPIIQAAPTSAKSSNPKGGISKKSDSSSSFEEIDLTQIKGLKKPKRTSVKSNTIELGVYCTDLRYSEEEHGSNLPAAFKKAREHWRISGNNPSNPSYVEACKLLSRWYKSYFQIRLGLSISMDIDEDNQVGSAKSVAFKDSTEAVEHSFSGEPLLKSCSVVFIDFRSNSSSDVLREDEKLLKLPEVGVLAIYEVNLGNQVKNAVTLAKIIRENESVISECFHIELDSKVIETISVDDDGDEITSSSSSWTGGDIKVEVNINESSEQFLNRLTEEIRKEHQTISLLDDSVPPIKKLFILANTEKIENELDCGLDINTRIEDEPLLKLSLMVAVTAENWFNHPELSGPIRERYTTLDEYQFALKKIVLNLLGRGADVNANAGAISILAVAEVLNDTQIVTICRERADTANDLNSNPFLLAAERGDVDALKALLARLHKRDFLHGTTPLMLACQGPGGEDAPPLMGQELANQVSAVKFLLEQGADIDAKSDTGDTAIGNAVRRGNTSIVEILISAGAKTTSALPRGRSLLALAKDRKHSEVIKLLSSKKL